MKAGDAYPVSLGEWQVATATIVELDGDQAILEIPATRIVMGISKTLTDLAPEKDAKETLIIGSQDAPVDEAAAALIADGVELDDTDDFVAPSGSPVQSSTVSLKDMKLDDNI